MREMSWEELCECPVTTEVCVEPVVASDGRTYDKSSWDLMVNKAGAGDVISPMDRSTLLRIAYPNRNLAQVIGWLREHHGAEASASILSGCFGGASRDDMLRIEAELTRSVEHVTALERERSKMREKHGDEMTAKDRDCQMTIRKMRESQDRVHASALLAQQSITSGMEGRAEMMRQLLIHRPHKEDVLKLTVSGATGSLGVFIVNRWMTVQEVIATIQKDWPQHKRLNSLVWRGKTLMQARTLTEIGIVADAEVFGTLVVYP
jgi:hypothetical protein